MIDKIIVENSFNKLLEESFEDWEHFEFYCSPGELKKLDLSDASIETCIEMGVIIHNENVELLANITHKKGQEDVKKSFTNYISHLIKKRTSKTEKLVEILNLLISLEENKNSNISYKKDTFKRLKDCIKKQDEEILSLKTYMNNKKK